MINLFFPFIFLSIISLLVSVNLKINLNKSYLISILSIPLIVFFTGNFLSLYWAIYLITLITLAFLIVNQNYKKIYKTQIYKKLLFYFIIYFLITLYSSNFFLHKYDEFSEYGIISKLIFFEEELMKNIHNIFAKGSPHKINIMGYLNYFFLKTSFLPFKEQILYISQNTLNIIIILNLIDFISGNIKKICFFIILFFLSFILSTGFDKIYLDTTAGLLISLTIAIQLQDKNKSKYLIIFLSLIFLFALKTSATIILLGITSLFIIYYLLDKNLKVICFYLFIILSTLVIEKLYKLNFHIDKKNHDKIIKQNYLSNISYTLDYNKKINNIKKFDIDILFSKNNYFFLKKNFIDLSKKGIYHSSTFLIFNKIFEKLNINLKLIEIPLTLFFWILLLIILIKFINIQKKSKLFLFINTYILFIFFYWLIILYWAHQNRLINEDLSIEVSWQRHLGTIILGILLYLLIILFQKNKMRPNQIIFILFFLVMISKPNSIRNFFPNEFIMKDDFWLKKYQQRLNISNLSNFINNNSEKYSTIIYYGNNNNEYFFPILNYELIDKNLINFDLKILEEKIYNDNFKFNSVIKQNENLYILVHKVNKEDVIKFIKSKNLVQKFVKEFNNQYAIYKISSV